MAGKHSRIEDAPLFSPLTLTLGVIALFGAWFILQRFIHGIGAVTNVNAGYPWGIWVVGDIVIGTAVGCGGFAMALLVYVFNHGHYHPLMRPALLGGLFGYTLAGAAVVIDLGRWWQFYNVLNPTLLQFNSVMAEIALCVMAYVTVLWIEFSPAIFERLGLHRARAMVEKWMWVFIALGVVLPTMHQSSLGSALLVLGQKLSPLYYTPLLPLLFVSSALAMGYAAVVFEATIVTHAFRRKSEHDLLARLSRVVGWIVVFWLALRWGDIIVRGVSGEAVAAAALTFWFWLEILLAVAAAACFLSRRLRDDERATFLGGCALLLFGALFRINAYLVAYRPVGNYDYFPSAPELLVTFGILAFEILLYLVFIKIFPVLHAAPDGAPAAEA
jgi:Ni/Fe-hydrogenase subunit HybB-like protein